jgi:hypothetical protein
MTPSRTYLDVAHEVQAWIAKHHPPAKPVEPSLFARTEG